MTVHIPASLIVYALVFAAGCLYGWVMATENNFGVVDKLGLIFCEFVTVAIVAGLIAMICGYPASVLLY